MIFWARHYELVCILIPVNQEHSLDITDIYGLLLRINQEYNLDITDI